MHSDPLTSVAGEHLAEAQKWLEGARAAARVMLDRLEAAEVALDLAARTIEADQLDVLALALRHDNPPLVPDHPPVEWSAK